MVPSHSSPVRHDGNSGSTYFDINISNIFSYLSPQARETTAKKKQKKKNKQMNKYDYIWLGKENTAKEAFNKAKRQPTEWEIIFANDASDKRLKSKI